VAIYNHTIHLCPGSAPDCAAGCILISVNIIVKKKYNSQQMVILKLLNSVRIAIAHHPTVALE